MTWWQDAVIYQIYPRSFADATGDGYGDLPGIIARLPYLSELGVDALWLSPFYASPMHDGGYDVADYRKVDALFGTLSDAELLLERAHELGIRVIIDLVPNHTSVEHAWFRAACTSAHHPARDSYIFRDGRGEGGEDPPNNWRSVFGGPAWTCLPATGGKPRQWYLHLFDSSQPDLNWNNPAVRQEFREVLHFWLARGVDGFRVDVAHALVKAGGLPDWDHDEAITSDAVRDPGPMWDQEGVHEIYRDWHQVLAQYRHDPILVAEAWVSPPTRLARYLRSDEMHQAFNFDFLECRYDAAQYRSVITASIAATAAVGARATWVLSNHDVVRATSRFGLPDPGDSPAGIGWDDVQPDTQLGLRRARAVSLLMFALPGACYVYQGEELGLPEATCLPDDARQDPVWERTNHRQRGRDGCRVPIPWQGGAAGFGFSATGATWLPQPKSYGPLAVDQQCGVPDSTLELFRAAIKVRRQYHLGTGELTWIPAPDLLAPAASWQPNERLAAADLHGATNNQSEHSRLLDTAASVLIFENQGLLVIANLGETTVTLTGQYSLVLSSLGTGVAAAATIVADSATATNPGTTITVPAHVTVWLKSCS